MDREPSNRVSQCKSEKTLLRRDELQVLAMESDQDSCRHPSKPMKDPKKRNEEDLMIDEGKVQLQI